MTSSDKKRKFGLTKSSFIGREDSILKFKQLLDQESNQVSILVINGIGGVGKTTLMLRLLDLACQRDDVVAATVDESNKSVIEAMRAIEQEIKPHYALKTFTDAYMRHQEITGQIESDPDAPKGLFSLAVRGAVASIYRLTTGIPVDPGVSELAGASVDILTYIYQHFKSKEERDLILNPEISLSRKFVDDLNGCASRSRRVILFFDAYEKTREYLNSWMQKMIQGEFGQLDDNVLIVVSTRGNFIDDGWAFMILRKAIEIITLDPFTESEARVYLGKVGVVDTQLIEFIIRHSKRLPILMAYFASIPSLTDQDAARLITKILLANKPSDLEEQVFERASLPRSFNQDILDVVLEQVVQENNKRGIRDIFDWLSQQNFIFTRKNRWYYHESIRSIMLRNFKARTPTEFLQLHKRLSEYYEPIKNADKLYKIEYFYHKLWIDPINYLAEALEAYLDVLRTDFPNAVNWVEMLQQIASDVDDEREYDDLRRMSSLIKSGFQFIERLESYDQAEDLFYASRKINVHENTLYWLTYLEFRLVLKKDGPNAALAILKDLISKPSLSGELMFYVLIDISDCYSRLGQLAKAMQYADQALELANTLINHFFIGLANFQLSLYAKRKGNYWDALIYNRKSYDAFEKGDTYPFQIGKVLLGKATTLIYIGKFDEAKSSLQECLEIFERTSPLAYAETKHRLGWLNRLTGNLDVAWELHRDAIEHLELLGEEALLAKALHSMGNVLNEQLQYHNALVVFNKALALFNKLQLHRHVALVTIDRAWTIFRLGNLEEAVSSIISSFTHLKEDISGLTQGNLTIARILIFAGRFDEARPFLDEAQNLCDKCNKDENIILLDSKIKLEQANYMLLKHNLEDARKVVLIVEEYAQRRQLFNFDAQVAVIRGVIALQENRTDLTEHYLLDAIRKARSWNPYFMEETVYQMLNFLTYIDIQNESMPKVLHTLKSVIEKDLPQLSEKFIQVNSYFDEMIDYYDAEGHHMGIVSRAEAHERGLWHRSFHCWIISQNKNVSCLAFQCRGANKLDWPNFLDISSAGHFRAGEGIVGGIRELHEELRIDVAPDQLLRIATRIVDETNSGRINRERQEIYFLQTDLPLSSFYPNFPEVSGVYLLNIKDVDDLLNGRTNQFGAEGLGVDFSTGKPIPSSKEWTRNDFIPNAMHYLRFIVNLAATFVQYGYPNMLTVHQADEIINLPDGSRWMFELTK